MTSDNEFKKLSIIRSRIDRLREQLGPSEDKRLVRDLFDEEMRSRLFPPSPQNKLAFFKKK